MKLANLILMFSLMVVGCGRDPKTFHRPNWQIPAVLDLTNGSVFYVNENWNQRQITIVFRTLESGWCELNIVPATLERRDGGFVIDRSVFNANGPGLCGSEIKTTWQNPNPAKVFYLFYFDVVDREYVPESQMNDIEIID